MIIDCVLDFWDLARLLDAIALVQGALQQHEKEIINQWFYKFLMFISGCTPLSRSRYLVCKQ